MFHSRCASINTVIIASDNVFYLCGAKPSREPISTNCLLHPIHLTDLTGNPFLRINLPNFKFHNVYIRDTSLEYPNSKKSCLYTSYSMSCSSKGISSRYCLWWPPLELRLGSEGSVVLKNLCSTKLLSILIVSIFPMKSYCTWHGSHSSWNGRQWGSNEPPVRYKCIKYFTNSLNVTLLHFRKSPMV